MINSGGERKFFVSHENRDGFTIIEILVSSSIIIALAAIGILAYRSAARQVDLQIETQKVISILHLARSRTLASVDQSRYGVHVDSAGYTLFKGASYNAASPANEVYELPAGVEMYDISLGGGNDVIFDRLTGATAQTGSLKMRRSNNPSQFTTIEVAPSGISGLPGQTQPVDSRVTDTRHMHFDLGWSIKNSDTLTLFFPDTSSGPGSDIQVDIAMADFFNSDRTSFLWADTIDVRGAAQTLRLNTHLLDDTDTIVSIRRDGRFNTQALEVSIDDQAIVSYTSDGTATAGASGGAMTVQ